MPEEVSPFGVSSLEARQIANIVSGKLRVNIKQGNNWSYNFDTKTIQYRDLDLSYLTQEDVVANLLHEGGHAKYSIGPQSLVFPGVKDKHKKPLKELVNVIEDFRIEDLLRKYYPYALDYLPEYSFKTLHMLNSIEAHFSSKGEKIPSFLIYCFGIYGALAKCPFSLVEKRVIKKVNLTKKSALKARLVANTQILTDIICTEIYPHIKDLLDECPNRQSHLGFYISTEECPPERFKDPREKTRSLIQPTAKSLEKVLTAKNKSGYAGKFRTGPKLDKRRLYRFKLDDFRLFKRRYEENNLDYVFSLVVDESGSMTGKKTENAQAACFLFATVLDKIKIPFSLHGFNSLIKHYKGFQEAYSQEKGLEIIRKMSKNTYDVSQAGYNNDGQAISEVASKMKGTAEQKIMIVISDGDPAPTGIGHNFDLCTEIKKAEKQGVKVIGVGIGEGQRVAEYYHTNLVVRDIEDLPQTIVSQLKKELKS